jgi:hypothetical protein
MGTTTDQSLARRPIGRLGALSLGGVWLAVAVAETVRGNLGALDDVQAIAEGSDRLTTAGGLHLVAGVCLAYALVGLAPLLWGAGRLPRTGLSRWGWWASSIAVPCFGAFGMLHLLAIEAAAPGLDGAAMQQFLVERLGGGGAWNIPVAVAAIVMPFIMLALLYGLARADVVSWWAPFLVAFGAVVHAFGWTSWVDIASHWLIAVGGIVATIGLWRSTTTPWTPALRSPARAVEQERYQRAS